VCWGPVCDQLWHAFPPAILRRDRRHPRALTVSEVAQGQVVGFSSNPRWSNGADEDGFFFFYGSPDSPLTLWQLVYQALFWDSAIFSHAVVEGDPLLCIALFRTASVVSMTISVC